MKNTSFVVVCIFAVAVSSVVFAAEAYKMEYDNPNIPIEITAGQEFVLRLDSNPTTGYGWKLADGIDEDVAKFVSSKYRQYEVKLVGSGGSEYWTFEATGSGTTAIKMQYVRSWEENEPPAEEKVFTVNVKG